MKKWTIIVSTFLIMACNQKTFTIDEVKGTYSEVETKHSKWNENCSLVVTDSTVTLRNCRLLKDFTGNKIRIVENRLLYHFPDYYTSFEIFEKDGVIHLYQPVEEHEDITFRKVE